MAAARVLPSVSASLAASASVPSLFHSALSSVSTSPSSPSSSPSSSLLALSSTLARRGMSSMSTASAVDVLSHQDPSNPSVLIDSFSSMGFTVNGVTYVGSMALFPRVPLLWNVKSVEELTPESLTLFHLVNPKIELLLIGTGSKIETIDPAVRQMLKEKRISLEVLDTPHAATTFNFLSQEGRLVAAALIPIAPETPASTNP